MHWKNKHTLHFPTLTRFGPGVVTELGDYLNTKNLKRPLLVTDPALRELDFFKKIARELEAKKVRPIVFSEINKNPVKKNVISGISVYKNNKADSIVAIGGGASMDVGRAIALGAYHNRDLFDFDDALGGEKYVKEKIPHFICVPTTSGTGSEVGRSAVISEDIGHKKRILFSPKLMAKMVFADPELTMNLPPKITAATGVDAITHNIEAYVAKGFNPLCDGIAAQGFKLAALALKGAVKRPDIVNRSQMMMASLMGACAFQKGLGVVHSCAHPLSTKYDTHHGLSNALMLAQGLEYNMPVASDKYRQLSSMIGEMDFMPWLRGLLIDIEMPQSLSDIGARVEDIDDLARLAMADPCHHANPKTCSEEDFKMIYHKALR